MAFFKYTYAFADEYEDVVPKAALEQKHVFGSYENIGHDVWHAAYGVYCPTLDAQKTVQYDWLLKQSLDGTPFVDPRDPNAGVGGSGGAAGATSGGSAGSAGTSAGGSDTAGSGGMPALTAGTTSVGTGGSATAAAGTTGSFVPNSADSGDSGGCSTAPAPQGTGATWLLLFGAVAGAAATRPRRALRRARGDALRAPVR
jgi:hypothetical protein